MAMDPFEEPKRESIISSEKAAEYAADTMKVATAVASLFKQEGWQIFRALFEQKKQEVKDKDDYASLEDFKADRRALKTVEDMIGELASYIDDASRARDLFNKIIDAEGQTPRSTAALSTGTSTEA